VARLDDIFSYYYNPNRIGAIFSVQFLSRFVSVFLHLSSVDHLSGVKFKKKTFFVISDASSMKLGPFYKPVKIKIYNRSDSVDAL